jgi:hypothetical protein
MGELLFGGLCPPLNWAYASLSGSLPPFDYLEDSLYDL